MTRTLALLVGISLGWPVQATQIAALDVESGLRAAGAYFALGRG